MGLSVIDVGERFNIAESMVNIFLTWINYLYVTLGSIKLWPHRDIILQNEPAEFLEKYTNNILIFDATELKVEVPSVLQKHNESYSTYISHTALKCLLGIEPKGGSCLYFNSVRVLSVISK